MPEENTEAFVPLVEEGEEIPEIPAKEGEILGEGAEGTEE